MEHPDLLVVGAGGAGLFAALYAADHGLEVLVLEKDIMTPSNTEISSALVPAAGSRYQRERNISDTPEALFEDIQEWNGGLADPALLRAICRCSANVIHFIADRVGIEMHLHMAALHPGHRCFRMHGPLEESGKELVDGMRRAADRHSKIKLKDGIYLESLWLEDGVVSGVTVSGSNGMKTIEAKSTLLACGGFGANRALLSRYCPEMAEAAHIGSSSNTGAGILAGVEAGAALGHMSAYQAHSHANPEFNTHLTGALPGLGAIIVNLSGRRFAAEDMGSSQFAKHLMAQPKTQAIEIFDQCIFDAAMAFGPFRQAWTAGAVKSAPTLEALAGEFRIPTAALASEIAAYNDSCRDGGDRFGRRQFGLSLTPPFYGATVTAALAHSQGGLWIDEQARVVGADGSAIPGLFAAGGTAASISGDNGDGYMSGNGLLQTFGTALLAAEAVALD